MAPRTALGATSDMYRMMMAETNPTPRPAMRRPGTSRETDVEATCRMTPSEKMMHPAMMVDRRPIQSATEPAINAPKKVPADRMDTMSDFCQVGISWSTPALVNTRHVETVQRPQLTRSERFLEELHAQHSRNVPGVITKQDTPKGREHAEQIALERDRRLYARITAATCRRRSPAHRFPGSMYQFAREVRDVPTVSNTRVEVEINVWWVECGM